MRKSAAIIMALGALMTLSGSTCLTSTAPGQPNPVQQTGQAVGALSGAVPVPYGGIVAAVGALITVIGSIFAKGAVNNTMANGGPAAAAKLSPITKVFAERKWLWPSIAGAVAVGNAAGLWNIPTAELITLAAALGVPAIGEHIADALNPTAPSGGGNGAPVTAQPAGAQPPVPRT